MSTPTTTVDAGTHEHATATSPAPGVSIGPERPRQRWRRWRRAVVVIALLLIVAVVVGLVQSSQSRGSLDPEGIDAGGSRALARLLEEQGVRITSVRTTSEAVDATRPGDTMLVTVPDLLTADQLADVVDTGARLVLVEPRSALSDVAPGLDPVRVDAPAVVEPGCALPLARRAGPARLGGLGYRGDVSRTYGARCYGAGGEPTLVVTASAGGSPVAMLGTSDPLTNEYLDRDGNAALATGLLGQTQHLVWYRPVPEAGTDGAMPLTDELPDWVRWAVWQLAVAAALAALWRARRLGRLVPERLPVAVRASETTEGRARLYRHGRSRAHAAALLRDAAIRRLDPAAGYRQGPPSAAEVSELSGVLAERTGRPAEQIATLLGGPPPADDAGLVRLADDLDALEAADTDHPERKGRTS